MMDDGTPTDVVAIGHVGEEDRTHDEPDPGRVINVDATGDVGFGSAGVAPPW